MGFKRWEWYMRKNELDTYGNVYDRNVEKLMAETITSLFSSILYDF